jgi:iron complex outermembrane receptor protein
MKTLFALLSGLTISCGAFAQSASIAGIVKDPQGKPIAGASLTLFSRTGAANGATTSGPAGAYRFENLPAGEYLLRAAASGFAPFLAEDLSVAAGASLKRDISLQVAGPREQVVVTASGTPQAPEQVSKATAVVDQSEADARDAAALSTAVALLPGIRVEQLGGPGAFTSIRIRGLRYQDTALLVDGLRLRDASATQSDASGLIEDLLWTDTSRIEVMSGAGSSLYGANAIGGVINVITSEGGGRARGSLLLEGGSLGAFRGRAQFAGGLRNDRIQYSAGFAQTTVVHGVGGDEPFRDASAQGRVTVHFSPAFRLTARLYGADSFSKVRGEPDLIGSFSGDGIVNAVPLAPPLVNLFQAGTPLSQLNTGAATFVPATDNPDYTRAARFISAAVMLNGQAAPTFDYSVSYQLVSNSHRYGDGPAGVDYQPDGSTRTLYDGRIQTLDAQLHSRIGRFTLLSGGYEFESESYAYDYADQNSAAAASSVNATQRSHSVFAQEQAQFLDGRLQISAAFRAQFFQLDTPAFAPAAAAPYQGMNFPSPTPAYTGDSSAAYYFRRTGTKLRAHVGRGYRAPSLFERFGAGFDPVYGYTVYGDPRLKPEHSIGADAGIEQSFLQGRLKASVGYFYTSLQDVIAFDTSGLIDSATDPYGRFIGYFNTKGGISRGLETSAAFSATSSLRITGAYTYVNAIQRTPLVGDVLRTFVVPRNQFSLFITEQPTSRLFLTIDTLASSSYLAPVYGAFVTQTYRFDGQHKVNIGASYRLPLRESRAVRFFARAENLFDQTYFESGFLTPGRTASAGLQFEF